ncbi:MAG TPA: cytochrome P450, partial [Ktedonobacteraceae bacterium]|nr:cytochrome P450 [Ktedonobacteraceae bacterium]
RYLPMMIDIAEQLMEKWERLNPDDEVDVTSDMTRLTLDIIGLCGFGYRFNSFYRESSHPFIKSMVRSLAEVQESARRLPIQEKLMLQKHHQFQADVNFMYEMADRIIKERKEAGEESADTKDLLSYMLTGVDKQSGERLDEGNIRYQMITFLVAGHETTSGLLSFTLYYLLRNPAVLARAYQEVSRVLGNDPSIPPTFAQIHQLTYLSQILKEILRLWPTAPAFSRQPLADETIIGGKYRIHKEQIVTILTPMLHRDKHIWGEDAEEFNPDHFSSEAEQRRPNNAYKPFGTGQRACIGRQFAMQEATLVLAMLLQRFHLIDHKRYQLKIKQTLSLKPDGLTIQVKKRTDLGRNSQVAPTQQALRPVEPVADVPLAGLACPHLMEAGSSLDALGNVAEVSGIQQVSKDAAGYSATYTPQDNHPEQQYAADQVSLQVDRSATTAVAVSEHSTPLLVLYGSNLGTSEDVAERIAEDGRARGFTTAAGPLDEYVNRLPKEGAVIIVSASYNGTPPDNATRFYHWLKD